MKHLVPLALALCLVLLFSCTEKKAEEPLAVIYETDMGNDVDDALGLDLIYKYVDAGKVDLLAVMLNKEGTAPAEYVDLVNTWYGYPETPIGIIHDGADCENDAVNYARAVCAMTGADSVPAFARTLSGYDDLPDAHLLYRKILASQPDHSVTVISVGFSTNLARLLATAPDDYSPLTGRELVARKVKLLSMMAGCFNGASPAWEYNVIKDTAAAHRVFADWPTPIVTSPVEVGAAVCYPAQSIENDFSWADPHPVIEAYKAYRPMPYDEPMFDPTAIVYALEGDGFFTMSLPGRIEVDSLGGTVFQPDQDGSRRYFHVNEAQADSLKNFFIKHLTSRPKKYAE
ncbi:MAG: nucleoside hydrolase [Bacteroidaceae bacterium]|nr:nucleoside hydrolase [Bacteroidaceae bacterium]